MTPKDYGLSLKEKETLNDLIQNIMSYQTKEGVTVVNSFNGIYVDGIYFGPSLTEASIDVLEMFEERKQSGEVFEPEVLVLLNELSKKITQKKFS